MSCLGRTGAISSDQKTKYDIFYWKIDAFTSKSENAGENSYYYSPDFKYKDIKRCWLRLYPNGVGSKSGLIGFCFRVEGHGECNFLHLTLGLETQSKRIEKWFSGYIFFPQKDDLGFPIFKQKSEFLKRKQELVPSDCLTVVVILSLDEVKIIRGVLNESETGHAEENSYKEKKGGEKVLGDMAKLLASGDKSDAVIVVRESEYKVHSCILSARTPVFAALFEHDTLEKVMRKVNISDCEPAIFAEFLHYIYTGSVENLTAENSLGLYKVAEKYLVKELKDVSMQCIRDNLSVEMFSEVIQLALMYKDEVLLESACDYFVINIRHIIKSVEWQQYIKENPIEANEILIRSFCPP